MDKEKIIEALKTCYDPEVPINIFDMGLIYDIEDSEGFITIKMTLTSMGCPAGPQIVEQVREKVSNVPNVKNVEVVIVWEPAWSPEKMSEEAKLEMGMM
jgi:FeS assembly SUF system protein